MHKIILFFCLKLFTGLLSLGKYTCFCSAFSVSLLYMCMGILLFLEHVKFAVSSGICTCYSLSSCFHTLCFFLFSDLSSNEASWKGYLCLLHLKKPPPTQHSYIIPFYFFRVLTLPIHFCIGKIS